MLLRQWLISALALVLTGTSATCSPPQPASSTSSKSGPTYVASLIAMFYAHASGHTSVVSTIHPGSEDFETSYAAAAVVPLTELVAARGLIDTVPVLDWLLAGGAQLKVKDIVAIARTRYLVVRALCLRPDASITPIFG